METELEEGVNMLSKSLRKYLENKRSQLGIQLKKLQSEHDELTDILYPVEKETAEQVWQKDLGTPKPVVPIPAVMNVDVPDVWQDNTKPVTDHNSPNTTWLAGRIPVKPYILGKPSESSTPCRHTLGRLGCTLEAGRCCVCHKQVLLTPPKQMWEGDIA